MEVKVFQVIFEIETIEPEDYPLIGSWNIEYKNMFPSKSRAIAKCQSLFAKQPVNKYVEAVHAEVRIMKITDKRGIERGGRIYNKYKER